MPPRASPTHFLCIPLAGVQLARSLSAFRHDVTSAVSFGVPQDAVRPLGTLHLTLGVMSLKGDVLDRAVDLLKSVRFKDILARVRAENAANAGALAGVSEAPGKSSLAITLQGIHPMQAASKTSVLYAPPADPSGILYRFCERIRAVFQDAGLMIEDNRPLLLHATIINTIYVKGQHAPRGKRREKLTIDARDIVSRYDDYVWIEDMPVNRIAICRMGAKKIEGTDDEAYEVEAEIEM